MAYIIKREIEDAPATVTGKIVWFVVYEHDGFARRFRTRREATAYVASKEEK